MALRWRWLRGVVVAGLGLTLSWGSPAAWAAPQPLPQEPQPGSTGPAQAGPDDAEPAGPVPEPEPTSEAATAPEAAQSAPSGERQAVLAYERNTMQIVRRHGPSVVAIDVRIQGRRVGPFEAPPSEGAPEFFEELLPSLPLPPRRGSGSGFVIDRELHVLTNFHVVSAALQPGKTELAEGAAIQIVFSGEQNPLPARVLGASALYDLALLELSQSPPPALRELEPIELADSDRIQVGQQAIAIGNPFGFASSVTTGIVSGIGRTLPGVGQVEIPLVQTDAAINPGNSGGPLLDSAGQLIGVNTAIIPGGLGGASGFVGLGFALPSNLVRENLPALLAGGLSDLASRARIGVSIVELAAYPAQIRESLELPARGVAIAQVQPGGPAERAGLRGASFQVMAEGQILPAGMDVIVAVDGQSLENASELQQRILARGAGERVLLDVWRRGVTRQVSVQLEVIAPERESQPERESEPDPD